MDVSLFRVGGIYDLPTSLATLFIVEGCAEPADVTDTASDRTRTSRLSRFGRKRSQ